MAAVDSFELLYREISRSCGYYVEPLALLGAAYAVSRAAVLLGDCCALLRVHFLPRMIPRKQLRHRFGDWAVIYGSSQPVAMAYAEELARNGISIVFVSQNHAVVREAAASLSQDYGVETVIVLADFSLDPAASKPIREALAGRDVGFLVTCVDEPPALLRLMDAPEQELLDAANRNVAAATVMTRLVLPGMAERRRGAVVNISPAACCRPRPGRATLAAFTGYMDRLSRALQMEHSRDGIFIQSLTPFQIASSPSQPSRESWLVPKPDVYARHAVSTLGVSSRTTGYWPHTLQLGLIRCVPEWMWVLGFRVFIGSS